MNSLQDPSDLSEKLNEVNIYRILNWDNVIYNCCRNIILAHIENFDNFYEILDRDHVDGRRNYKYILIQIAQKINLEKIISSDTIYFKKLCFNKCYYMYKFMPYFLKSIINNTNLVHRIIESFDLDGRSAREKFDSTSGLNHMLEKTLQIFLKKYIKNPTESLFEIIVKYINHLQDYTFETKHCKLLIEILMTPTKYEPALVKKIKKIKIQLNVASFYKIIKKLPDEQILVTSRKILELFTNSNDFFISKLWISESYEHRFIKTFMLRLPYEYFKKYIESYLQYDSPFENEFEVDDLIYLYEHQQFDSIKYLLDEYLCDKNKFVAHSLSKNKLTFLDFYTKSINYQLDSHTLQNFIYDTDKCNKDLDKVLEWIHTKACGYDNILTNEIIDQIFTKFSNNVCVLEWLHSFKKCHSCKCDINLPQNIITNIISLFDNKKAYNWWIEHDFAIDMNQIKIDIDEPTFGQLDLYKKHKCNFIYNVYYAYVPEKLLWCKNNDIEIVLNELYIDNTLMHWEELLKYYNIYDWLQSKKIITNTYC